MGNWEAAYALANQLQGPGVQVDWPDRWYTPFCHKLLLELRDKSHFGWRITLINSVCVLATVSSYLGFSSFSYWIFFLLHSLPLRMLSLRGNKESESVWLFWSPSQLHKVRPKGWRSLPPSSCYRRLLHAHFTVHCMPSSLGMVTLVAPFTQLCV